MTPDVKQALTIVAYLRSNGIESVVAGGAARDTKLGLVPKDYDLVVLGDYCVDEVIELLDGIPGCGAIEPFGNGSSMANCEDAKLDWVVKFRVQRENGVEGYIELDIIQHKSNPTTPQEAVECFDCTLNMCWFGATGSVRSHSLFPMQGEPIRVMPLCDYPRARVRYLSAKFPQYGWPTDDQLQSHPNYAKG